VLVFALDAVAVSWFMMMAGLTLALSYSLKPLALSYKGLGELSMGFMVSFLTPVTSFYALYGSFDELIVLATIPLVLQLMGLMMVVEYPDRTADLAAGKRTLVVRMGASKSWTAGIFMLVLGGASAIIGGTLGLPVTAAWLCGAMLLGEAAIFWMIGRAEESKSRIFWSTAISCGFYVLVIALMAATISA
jgi:1,4-dihydroxy-2-naphthoate octaprenyltransferase